MAGSLTQRQHTAGRYPSKEWQTYPASPYSRYNARRVGADEAGFGLRLQNGVDLERSE